MNNYQFLSEALNFNQLPKFEKLRRLNGLRNSKEKIISNLRMKSSGVFTGEIRERTIDLNRIKDRILRIERGLE